MLHTATAYAIAAITSLAVIASPGLGDAPTDPSPSPAGASRTAAAPAPAQRVHDRAGRSCGPEPTTAAGWQRLFDAQTGAWSGGDGASSTRLPDGRLLWLFSDTFVGGVHPDGSRATGTRLVRNSILVTDGDCVAVSPTATDAFPGHAQTWLWPTHAVVSAAGRPGGATTLVVFAQRVVRTGSGAFDFRRAGAVTVTVAVPWRGEPVVGAVRDLPASAVLWGAAVVTAGRTTWIYGTRATSRPLVFGRDLLLARAPTTTVSDPATWTYRTTSGWSPRAARAAVVRDAEDGVSTVPSALQVGRSFVIVTKPQEFLDDRVVALTSTTPWGPWTTRELASARSTESVPRYSPVVVAARSARTRAFVVAVSQTATTLQRIMADSSVTRPRFLDARLG